MDVIVRLADAVRKSGRKQSFVAAVAGLPAPKLNKILKGHQVPTVPEFIAIARAIDLDPGRLFTDGELVVELERLREAVAATQHATQILSSWLPETPVTPLALPKARPKQLVAPVRAAANPNAELIAEMESERKLIPRKAWNRGARIVARVIGDSMDGGSDPLRSGELAYLKPTRSPRTANGHVTLVRRDDGLYLKQFDISGDTFRLRSANALYDTITVEANEAVNMQIYGYLVDHAPEE